MKKNLLVIVLTFAVCISQAQSYKFAVICDTRSDAEKSGTNGVNVSAVKAVCKHLIDDGAEFVLAPGDFICGNVNWYLPAPPSNDLQLSTFLDAAKSEGVGLPGTSSQVTMYPVRGNHECYQDILPEDSVMAAWQRNIGYSLPTNGPEGEVGFTYSFMHENSLFIALDQYMHASANKKEGIEINQPWLDEELQKYPDTKHVFAFGHTPVFAAKHQDCLGEDSLKRNAFLNSINHKTDVYFCGHDHFYARADVPVYNNNGTVDDYIHQVITPSGAPFLTGSRTDNAKWNGVYHEENVIPETYFDNALGYQLITVEGNKVTIQFIATQDATTHTRDTEGVYHYTFNTNWETWNFVLVDEFSYEL